jgi:hypothetical protein
LDTGCAFWGETEPVMANAKSEEILVKQGEWQVANDGENPS